LSDPTWIKNNNKYKFNADPFFIKLDSGIHIAYEEFDFLSPKGKINILSLEGEVVRKNIIQDSVHLSYPYTFEYKGDNYILPESCESKNISIYRIDSKNAACLEKKILIDNFSGVDNTLFKVGKYFWIFSMNANDSDCEKLYAWYSDSVFSDWLPHEKNPIKVSKKSSRPGGRPFMVGNVLYRPAQNCTKHYGQALVINKIVCLTPQKFYETEEFEIKPFLDSHYSYGIHHIDFHNNIAVIDSKASVFSIIAFPLKLYQRVNIMLRRHANKN
jgi:hypothetical protein